MSWRVGAAVAIVGLLIVGIATGLGAAPGGTGPGDAVELVGTQSGSLATGKEFWYYFWDGGTNQPLGVALNFTPATGENNPQVTFKVWIYEKRVLGSELIQIGQGTVSSQPVGVKYWRGGSSVGRNYYLQVVNGTPGTINYAIAFTGAAYNPPLLAIAAPPLVAVPTVAPTPTAVPTVAPTAVPAPSPVSVQAGSSIDTAVPIEGVVTGRITDQHKWYKFYFAGGTDTVVGIVMNFLPTTVEDVFKNNMVAFRIWKYVCVAGAPAGSNCQYQDIGGGTRSGQPIGVKYWRHTAPPGTYYIEVFNHSGQPVGYALTLTGSTYPPAALSVPSP